MADGRRSPQPDKLASIGLPPGWEAKYDYSQKRYFFIDHKNKTTTWEDPRIKLQQQQQHVTGYHGGESQKLSPTHSKSGGTPAKSSNAGWQSQIEDKYGMKVEIIKDDTAIDPEAWRRITSRFPTAGKEVISMVMNNSASEETVCQKLHEMGYREQKPTSGSDFNLKSASASPSHQENSSTSLASSKGLGLPGIGTKSSGSQPSSPGHRLETSGKPSLPDLKRASPEKSVAAKNALSNSTEKRSASPARSKEKGSGHRGHHSYKASPLAEPTHDKKKRMREKLELEFKNLEKSVVESTLTSCGYDEEKARRALKLLVITKAIASSINETEKTETGQSGTNDSNKIPADDTTSVSLGSGESTDAMAKAATDKTNDDVAYASVLRRETKGPDPSLAKGPNKQLLLSDYVTGTGSQLSNCHGPSKMNYNGPRAELQRGPEPGLCKGPASNGHLASPSGSTISAFGQE